MTSRFQDNLKDWYKISGASGKGIKLDKNFKRHMIMPASRILILGPSGCGKTTAVIDWMQRMGPHFYRIIWFSASTTDEPLVKFLQDHVDGLELYDDIDQLPDLTEMETEDDKNQPKLIVFDDFINLPKKQMSKIQKWINSSRKFGYTCILQAQNIVDTPTQIRI